MAKEKSYSLTAKGKMIQDEVASMCNYFGWEHRSEQARMIRVALSQVYDEGYEASEEERKSQFKKVHSNIMRFAEEQDRLWKEYFKSD